MSKLSYWADIYSYFSKITSVKTKNKGFTIVVTGIYKGESKSIETSYQHKKVATAVKNKLKNISAI